MTFVVRKPGETLKDNAKRGYSAVLYGPPLVGKTTTLANLSAEIEDFTICLIDLDKNSTTVEESENVTIIGCDTFEDYLAVKEGANTGVLKYPGGELKMDFDLYVIDSFTTMEEKIKYWVPHTFAPKRAREIVGRFGAQTDWDDLQRTEVEQVRDWQAMTKRAVNPINVLWIGHDSVINNDMGQAFKTELMLQGKYAAPRIASAVDAMFYMFKMEREGVIYRGMYTIDNGIFKADARIAVNRRDDLPKVVWNPCWADVFGILGYQKN